MDIVSLIPILLIFGIGFLIQLPINKIFDLKMSVLDIFLHSFIMGIALIVFPLIWLGLAPLPPLFESWVFLLASLGILTLIISSFYYLKKILNYNFSENLSLHKNLFLFALILLLLGYYLIYAALLPLRGYDALFIYLPNSLWFFVNSSIPYFNGLNFVPTIKEPLNSLLFTFTLYVTGNFSIELIPVIFFIFWGVLTYKLCLKVFPNQQTLALVSFAMFLAFPANLWLMDKWAYYQDIYIGFFFTATIYFFLESQHSEHHLYFTFLTGICLALSLVSKLSGWSLFFILPLLVVTSKKGKNILSCYTGLLFGFLCLEGSFRIFIGIIPVFILFFILILYHLWEPTRNENIRANIWSFLSILLIGLFLGGYWLYITLQKFSFLSNSILNTYWNLGNSIMWAFKSANPSSPSYIFESAQSTNFFGIILILLIGNLFAVFWAFPKLISVMKRGSHSVLVIWVLVFFSIWIVYESTASIRYLTPIFSPLVILVLKGWFIIKEAINTNFGKRAPDTTLSINDSSNKNYYAVSNKFALFIIASGIVSLYLPIISLNNSAPSILGSIAQAYVYSEYLYYNNWFVIIILVIGLPALFILIKIYHHPIVPWLENLMQKTINNRKFGVIIPVFLLLIIIIIPLIVPATILALNNFNIQQFQQIYDYENRGAVQDIVDHIIADNNPSAAILTFNTPGLPIWTNQPTIDLFQQSGILEPIFSNQNISQGLELLLHPFNYIINNYSSVNLQNVSQPLITYIVVPNYGNLYYHDYLTQFESKSYLFPMLEHQDYFKLLYTNTEFRLYKRVYVNPTFMGVFDVGLTGPTINNSILGFVSDNMSLGPSIHGYLGVDLNQVPNQIVNDTVIIGYLSEGVLSYQNTTSSMYQSNKTFTYIHWNIAASNKTISLRSISGLIEYRDNQGNIMTSTYSFASSNNIRVLNINGEYKIYSGIGLQSSE